jgi:hypothetical protein
MMAVISASHAVKRKRCPDPIELLIAAARGPVHAVART